MKQKIDIARFKYFISTDRIGRYVKRPAENNKR